MTVNHENGGSIPLNHTKISRVAVNPAARPPSVYGVPELCMIKVFQTRACSHGEIDGIASSKPDFIISEVCRDAILTQHYGDPANGVLFSFYIFSAAIKGGAKYGDSLAEFIKLNGLGSVVETPEMINLKFHSQHSNKVYVWVVDHKATAEWYKKRLNVQVDESGFKMKAEDFNDEIDPNLDYEEAGA
jgi:hypothetical protein